MELIGFDVLLIPCWSGDQLTSRIILRLCLSLCNLRLHPLSKLFRRAHTRKHLTCAPGPRNNDRTKAKQTAKQGPLDADTLNFAEQFCLVERNTRPSQNTRYFPVSL